MNFKYDEDDDDEDVKRPVTRDQRPKREEIVEEEHEQHETSASNNKNNNKEGDQSKPELVKEVPRDKEREVNSTSRLFGIEDYARMVRLENNWSRDQFDLKHKVRPHYITLGILQMLIVHSQRGRKLRDRVRDIEPSRESDRRGTRPPWRYEDNCVST